MTIWVLIIAWFMLAQMSKYYNRVYEILVDDEVFIKEESIERQFHISFNITIDYGGYISYCDLAISNLTDTTAAKIFKKGAKIGFRVGYDETIDFVFIGKIRNVFKERNVGTTVHRIIARGNDKSDKTINTTFGVNTDIIEIIKACATSMGFPLVITKTDFDDIAPYSRGYVLHGDPRVYLDKLAKTHKFSYVVDKNRLIVTRNNSFQPGVPFEVSQFTGMVGIPEITEVGCDVSLTINPAIRIGSRIDIQSNLVTFNFNNIYFQDLPPQAGSGIYRVFKIRHTGDSHSDSWLTRITGNR